MALACIWTPSGHLSMCMQADACMQVKQVSTVAGTARRTLHGAEPTLAAARRYNKSLAREAVGEYAQVAQQHGLSCTQLALAWCKSRWNVTSTIIGATTMDQLKVGLPAPWRQFPWPPRPCTPASTSRSCEEMLLVTTLCHTSPAMPGIRTVSVMLFCDIAVWLQNRGWVQEDLAAFDVDLSEEALADIDR